jgi:hypothetical protein
VALEKVFREMTECLRRLHDNLLAVQLTIRVDTPKEGSVLLVDVFGDATDDVLGWLEEAIQAAREAQKGVGHPVDLDGARRALVAVQEQFHRAEQAFLSDLVSYERLNELSKFGKRRCGEWRAWVKSVIQGIEQCRQPMIEARSRIAECWQEYAECMPATSVSVQSGPRIVAKDLVEAEAPPRAARLRLAVVGGSAKQ